ncbi:unnamed protein product, partial [Mycena citricolor]
MNGLSEIHACGLGSRHACEAREAMRSRDCVIPESGQVDLSSSDGACRRGVDKRDEMTLPVASGKGSCGARPSGQSMSENKQGWTRGLTFCVAVFNHMPT